MDIPFQSNHNLLSVGKLISEKILGGIEFGGLEESIHEEIPCIYIPCPILGLRIELDGYEGFEEDKWYCLYIMYDPEVESCLSDEEFSKCNFFNQAFWEYIRKVLAQIPEISLLD